MNKCMRICTAIAIFALVGGFALFAGGTQEGAAASSREAVKTGAYGEAPALAERVQAGELPPVDERIGSDPRVIPTMEEIGKYGGTWRIVKRGGTWALWWYQLKENLLRWNADLDQIVPSVCKEYTVSPDGKTFTFSLREGMKYSDGHPVTADDWEFWYNDYWLNKDLSPSPPPVLVAGGQPATFRKIDDYTFQLKFDVPYKLFPGKLAEPRFDVDTLRPPHYLKQFHKEYADAKKLEVAMNEGEFQTWMDLFNQKASPYNNPERPSLMAWTPINPSGVGPVQEWERNPYYWQVDEEGNQLPYIDGIRVSFVEDRESALLKAIAGEADMQWYDLHGVQNVPTVESNKEKGDYRVLPLITLDSAIHTLYFNYYHPDPVVRDLYWNFDFRRAVSHAIDRQRMNKLLYKGLCEVINGAAVPPSSDLWDADIMQMYTEHDPQKANELLDKIGLKWDKNREYRLLENGERASFVLYYFGSWPPFKAEAYSMIAEDLADVGIEIVGENVDGSLWNQKVEGVDWDLAGYAIAAADGVYVPFGQWGGIYPTALNFHAGPKWGEWYATGGQAGEEPPQHIKKLYELYDEGITTASPERRGEIVVESCKVFNENLVALGMLTRPRKELFAVVHNRIGNVPYPPKRVYDDLSFIHPGIMYIKE